MGQYDNLSKEELLKLIKKQELDLKSKKYGLVWDDEKEPEQVVLDCRDNLPILKRVKTKEIKGPKDNTQEDNILIEGDNYHALTVLNYTHQEKIDVIYIDPPYNTGNKDFRYNDSFVDKEDGFRHSKWLNFMEKRLKLAKELLKKEGVIFISIDDNEMAQLKLLCDSIFGYDNFLANFIWKKRSGGGYSNTLINNSHEYILAYSKNVLITKFNDKIKDEEKLSKIYKFKDSKGLYKRRDLRKSGSADLRTDRPTMYYEVIAPDKSKIFPKRPDGRDGRWAYGETKYKELLKQGEVDFVKTSNSWKVYTKERPFDDDGNIKKEKYESLLLDIAINTQGTNELKNIFIENDTIFNNPKPVNLIKYFMKLSTRKDSIILDFMAGSGTTGHAVLELNKEDEGNRKFILCTNNENNICSEVTYPRIEKIIKGYKNLKNDSVEGLSGNLQYFKTSLLQQTKNRDQTKVNLTQKCSEMLCLKENIFNIEIEEEDYKIFSSNDNKKFLCIYFNFIDENFNNFLEKIKDLDGEKIIYMFSLEDKIDSSLFKDITNYTLEAIPKKILEVYKKLVKMNIPIRAETIFIDLDKAKKQIFEDKDKDTGAKTLRVVLEKLVQKIAQKNQINILTDKGKEIKLSTLNDTLKIENVFSKIDWEENKTYLTIGNHASHGEYGEFDLTQINKFYKHVQTLINKFNI